MSSAKLPHIDMKVRQSAKQLQYSLIALALASVCPLRALAQDAHSHAQTSQQQELTRHQKSQQSALLKIVRDATARFKDVTVAENEGYHLEFGCVSGPDSGAMGLHYVNDTSVGNGVVDPTRPQIVLYEAQPDGSLKLTGADYLVIADTWDRDACWCSAAAHGTDLSLLRGPESLRPPGVLHAACLGVEGQSQRRIRELAPRRFVPVIRRPNYP